MQKNWPVRGMLSALLVLSGFSASAETTAAPTPVVLELFTSQGCNSCPPADALLGELRNQPGVIALAFHVDYWDGLGWRDPYGMPESARRQRGYAQAMHSNNVFTPQLIVNGRKSVIGSYRSAVNAEINAARQADMVPIKAAITNGQLNVMLAPRSDHSRFNVNVVAYLPEATTSVAHGENAGRALKEFNVVRALRTLGVWEGTQNKFTLPISALPADVSQLAILIQDVDQGQIVGATLLPLR